MMLLRPRQPQRVTLLVMLVVVLVPGLVAAQPAGSSLTHRCAMPVARLVSFQGVINTRRIGGPRLETVRLNESSGHGPVPLGRPACGRRWPGTL